MPDADGVRLRSLEVDLAANSLRLVLSGDEAGEATRVERRPATIDVGSGGRLVGVELESGYVDVMPPQAGTEHLIRSAEAEVLLEMGEGRETTIALVLPRSGAGYEITYPSGNQ